MAKFDWGRDIKVTFQQGPDPEDYVDISEFVRGMSPIAPAISHKKSMQEAIEEHGGEDAGAVLQGIEEALDSLGAIGQIDWVNMVRLFQDLAIDQESTQVLRLVADLVRVAQRSQVFRDETPPSFYMEVEPPTDPWGGRI